MKIYMKTITLCALLIGIFAILPNQSMAQWRIGASYEIRQEAPENGFGVRLERSILGKAPIVDLRLRGHFSYFSENNYVDQNNFSYGTIENYDYGLAAIGGVSVGLLMPYVGVGLGSTTIDLQDAELPDGEEGSESKLFWNGLIGAEVSIIPTLKPFVEYRLQAAQSFEELENSVDESNGRLVFGISLAF